MAFGSRTPVRALKRSIEACFHTAVQAMSAERRYRTAMMIIVTTVTTKAMMLTSCAVLVPSTSLVLCIRSLQASVIEAQASAEWDAEHAKQPAVDENKEMEVVMGGFWPVAEESKVLETA